MYAGSYRNETLEINRKKFIFTLIIYDIITQFYKVYFHYTGSFINHDRLMFFTNNVVIQNLIFNFFKYT